MGVRAKSRTASVVLPRCELVGSGLGGGWGAHCLCLAAVHSRATSRLLLATGCLLLCTHLLTACLLVYEAQVPSLWAAEETFDG